MKANMNILFVSQNGQTNLHSTRQALDGLLSCLAKSGFLIEEIDSALDAERRVETNASYSFVGLFWPGASQNGASRNGASEDGARNFISTLRQRNSSVPIFIISDDDVVENIPLFILKEASEYINLHSETPDHTANRIIRSINESYRDLLPPYFRTLKEFVEDGDYYWDCPGHMGGMAYLKHPVGQEFINFFGENMMRADIGVATAEMGDYLTHAGPVKTSEEKAAGIFGADWTFFGVGGSSTSNRIVAQGAIGADEMVVVDRNCHKSLNHALTLSQGRPVYLKPTRNGYGLIGPIPSRRLSKESIADLVKSSPLAKDAVSRSVSHAVVTNCTYDGFCYNVNDVVTSLKASAPRLHFDEAWYAYAKFHPLYKGRFAMDVADDTPDRPTIFAVQSTHKMLPSLSMASMIHVKKSERAPLDFEDFNDAFMMHGTTSPFYPIIASIDVAVAMMEGEAGRSLVQESVEEAVAFRKTVVSVKRRLRQENGESDWFFDVLQPREVRDPATGARFSFEEAPMELLSLEPSCWRLRQGENWHGFSDEDLADTDSMLDPVKVTITCPGVTAQGAYEETGIPGCIVTKFLDDRRIEIARTGDYTLLILFSVGTTKGKWGTLIESLLRFKKLYDSGAKAVDAIPSLKAQGERYAAMTLKELCQQIHAMMKDQQMMAHVNNAVNADPSPVMTPAQAYQKVVRYQTEQVRLKDFAGRVSATMVTPYPPGIPVLMPGERLPADDTGIIGYLHALQEFDKRFPGFEHELQGVHIDENGDFWVRAIVESGTPKKVEGLKFRTQVSTSHKKGRA